MKLGVKIIGSALASVGATLLISLFVQKQVLRDQGAEMIMDSMRGILVAGDAMRDTVARLNKENAFRREELLAELKKSGGDLRSSTIYQTIPVVASWNAIGKAAEHEEYAFRTPRVNPRNEKNTPTPAEVKILEELETTKVDEIARIDTERGLLVVARPVRMTADCLSCHGDPATSPTGDGKDILGFKMENWKEGEVHGAFILTVPVSHIDGHTLESFNGALMLILPVTAGFAVLLVLGLRYTTYRFIMKPLRSGLAVIEEDCEKEVHIATEIASASTTLASAATQQAASLEETSAALEEISSMTKRNAEHADAARVLASETRQAADTGAGDMKEMITAMNDIKAASDNIAAIIKTIDEIAFQTNILALNAAVEAARAGEAGAGFAVVAEEVRALAQRSATAARETADKIEASIAKSEHGVAMSAKVNAGLSEIVQRARKVDELVHEIATGSKEQSQGIVQVNEAISQLDRVTQQNAATAEEAASASTELKSQSADLKKAIDQLTEVIGEEPRST